jgi:hypothetical protein
MSDEFVEVILGKVVEALGPRVLTKVAEPTLNAALALIDSIQPQSELQALLAVQIIATGFSGLEFLQQSQQHMTAASIDVYGSYAIKLFRLQAEMVRAFKRCRRGNQHTVEVRHVRIHFGAQGLVGIVNAGMAETRSKVEADPSLDSKGRSYAARSSRWYRTERNNRQVL